MKKIGLLIFSFLIFTSISWAATGGITLNPGQTIYAPRPMGLGNAFTALADDPNSIFLNPAGLNKLKYFSFTGVSRKIVFDETQYLLAGAVLPTDIGHWGFGVVDYSIAGSFATSRDPSTNRIIVNPSVESLSYDNNVFFLSYAKPFLEKKLLFGTNLKFFNQDLSGGGIGSHATALDIDLGLIYNFKPDLDLGLNWQNFLGSNLKWNSTNATEDKLGAAIKFGLCWRVLGSSEAYYMKNPHQTLKILADYDIPRNIAGQTSVLHLGTEWEPQKDLYLRGGIQQNSENSLNFSFGLGLDRGAFRFDYAYLLQGGNLATDNPHYFTISYLGAPPPPPPTDKEVKAKIKIEKPKDRLITDQTTLEVSGLIYLDKIETRTISTTEVKKIITEGITQEIVSPIKIKEIVKEEIGPMPHLSKVYLNQQEITFENSPTKEASFSVLHTLNPKRNVIHLDAYTLKPNSTLETFAVSNEVKVLKFLLFKDMQMTHWALEPIALISTLGIIQGYPDYSYNPHNGITRAELTKLLIETLDLPISTPEAIFSDVALNHWAAPHITTAFEKKIIEGYPDNTFKPKGTLTRAEAIAIIVRSSHLPEISAQDILRYSDIKENYWARKYILQAQVYGLIDYHKEKEFLPSQTLTRAEAAEILYRTKFIQEKVEDFWEKGIIPKIGQLRSETQAPEWLFQKSPLPTAPTTKESLVPVF